MSLDARLGAIGPKAKFKTQAVSGERSLPSAKALPIFLISPFEKFASAEQTCSTVRGGTIFRRNV